MEINNKLLSHFEYFLEIVPASRMKTGLRVLLMVYLKHELSVGVESSFGDMVDDLYGLFEFLDSIEQHCDQAELS
ncbi:hypothetical protein ACX0G9_23040 [Flavitalea flava]